MIEISSASQQDNIIELLNNLNEEGIEYSFKEKKGISLYFETNAEDLEKAAKLAKSTIKRQPWGSVLYFRSIPVK
ncbi:hypothetical protein ACS127_06680 [Amphibacillus sp. Q70]|uniref:hypothetical protein n=1 Tax=Amphibacillus sp. Q70 TaxID=3453416 RepID=UPI003F838751